MKFEYDDKKDDRECVAYIDSSGALNLPLEKGHASIYKDGSIEIYESLSFYNECEEEAVRKFYPGDKITITF